MRTFKLQVQVSADGYMAGPNRAMDWLTVPWTDDMTAYVRALDDPVDTIVLGRTLAEGFIPTWAAGPEGEDEESVARMNARRKIVVSRWLTESPWEGVTVTADVAGTVRRLKEQPGGDIIAYGGGTLVRSLIAGGLLDERNRATLRRSTPQRGPMLSPNRCWTDGSRFG